MPRFGLIRCTALLQELGVVTVARISQARDSWAEEFEQIAARVKNALGSAALRIDHIGSTSIPGLSAKDVIDIQVTVAELDADQLTAALSRLGFRDRPGSRTDHVPPGAGATEASYWTKLYFREPTGEREMHIHVRRAGRANQRYPLLFRDYLRSHPDVAASYAAFKERLAALQIDTGVYADIKDPVCDLIMAGAERWATETAWTA